ncbi:MAG: hypothetical protein ACT4PE_01695 [Candidatus Eiseniibacteriota bacterium]
MMFESWFAKSDLLAWPLVALAIFLVAFTVVLVREIRGLRRHERMDHVARLPLEADGREEV